MKFGVPAPAPQPQPQPAVVAAVAAEPRAPNAADITARLNSTRALLMAFQDNPSDTVLRNYNDLKLSLPKAIAEGNAFLVKAMSLSQALKKSDMTLTVPAPVK